MVDTVLVILLVLGCLVVLNWLFYLVLHLIFKKFRIPPGNLIAWQISGLMVYYCVTINTYLADKKSMYNKAEWQVDTAITVWSYSLMSFYNFSLCYEIYEMAKNPLNNKYDKRSKIYHILWQTIPIILTILWILFGGFSEVNRDYCQDLNGPYKVGALGLVELLDLFGLILIIMSIRLMNTSSRYLYRYVAFCVAEFTTGFLYIVNIFIDLRAQNISLIFTNSLFLFMAIWRILEVTVLNRYFNSMKRNPENDRMPSYAPPNQALFLARMISGVQTLLLSLTLIFDSLEQKKQGNAEANFQMTEHQQDPNPVEYKKWKLKKADNSFVTVMSQLPRSDIMITEYAPSIFKEIRIQNQISNSYLRDLFQAQDIDQIRKNVGNPGGASGCFFYFTSDKRFIMKTITKEEQQVMFDGFLNDYFLKIQDSLLARTYGIYEIKVGTQQPFSIILMGNLALPELEVIAQFDLKGSKVKRKVHESTVGSIQSLDPIIVYKDEDYENFIGGIFPYSPSIIIEKLISDSKFLEEHNIMDYSILLKICKPSSATSPFLFHGEHHSYCIGIIDFLQKYTWAKQAELKIKSILNEKEQISSQDPTKYAKRFRKKMVEYMSVAVIN